MNKVRIECIKNIMHTQFHPEFLEVIDESYLHQGHVGAQSGKGHFVLRMESSELMKLSRVQAHQKIYQALDDLFQTDIHALSIDLS